MTTTDDARSFIRRFLDTYEARELEKLWTFYSTDCRFSVLDGFGIEPTWADYKTFMTTFIDAFPDVHHEIDNMIVQDDSVWCLYTITGTHRGPIRGIQPTGRQIRYPMVARYRITDGLIAEADFVSDDLRMMRQLGALPA